jgi:hypothetical protein
MRLGREGGDDGIADVAGGVGDECGLVLESYARGWGPFLIKRVAATHLGRRLACIRVVAQRLAVSPRDAVCAESALMAIERRRSEPGRAAHVACLRLADRRDEAPALRNAALPM